MNEKKKRTQRENVFVFLRCLVFTTTKKTYEKM